MLYSILYVIYIYINQLKMNHRNRGGRSSIQSDCWCRKCARSPGTPERSTPRGFALRPFPNGRASQGDISGELATDINKYIYIYIVYIYICITITIVYKYWDIYNCTIVYIYIYACKLISI